MTKLTLIRHAQSCANQGMRFAGQTDIPLSDLGREQAERLKIYLRDFSFDAIYSSDLSRALETVLPTARDKGLPIRKDPALREIDGGAWDGLSYEEIAEKYPSDFEMWQNDIGNSRCTGGESAKQLEARAAARLKEIAAECEGQSVLLSTHAMFLRAALCFLKNMPLEEMRLIPWLPNASVTRTVFENGNFRILSLGECSFLDGILTSLPPDGKKTAKD